MTALTKFVDSKTETKYKMLRQKKKEQNVNFLNFFILCHKYSTFKQYKISPKMRKKLI